VTPKDITKIAKMDGKNNLILYFTPKWKQISGGWNIIYTAHKYESSINGKLKFYDNTEDFKTPEDIRRIFNNESGLLGISELSNDMREIEAATAAGNKNATLAYNMFIDRIIKHIGAYAAVMNGVDAIVFTAGIGENDAHIRSEIMKHFDWLGADIVTEKNEKRPVYGVISSNAAKVKVLVIPTDEELVIARDVERLKTK